jgi:hypothetical protein
VSCLNGSDNLLILKTELITDNLELAMSHGDVDFFGNQIHHFIDQIFQFVEAVEGDSGNLQQAMLTSGYHFNLFMKAVQFSAVVKAHQGSKDA